MDLSQLNAVSRSTILPTRKWADLEENKSYLVTYIKKVHTRFGEKTVVELDNTFQSFLPYRVNQCLQKNSAMYEDLEEAVQKQKLFVNYGQKGQFEFKID